MGTLAVIILTKNEQENIVDVVQNARQATNEVIIVDSGSTDNTVDLAAENGATVCFRAWDNDFAAQRNFGLTKTAADWVLYLDADERMKEETVAAVRAIVEKDELSKQYVFKRKSVAFGTEFNYGVLKPDYVPRMFPRTKVQWVNKVHERPDCKLPQQIVQGYLEHYTYTSWQQWEKKFCQYTTIWAQDAYANGKRTSLSSILAHSLSGFFKMFVLRTGFLDGWMGVFMCCNHFFYTMLKYLKLYEFQRTREK